MVKEACRWKDEAMMKEEMERLKDKKIRTMVNQNMYLKECVRNGTLFSARRTWEIWSHMLDVAGNYTGHSKYKASSWLCQCAMHATSRSRRTKNT